MYKLLYATAVSCCICAAAVGAMATPATGGDLEITVEGISDDEGNVMVALHDESGIREARANGIGARVVLPATML